MRPIKERNRRLKSGCQWMCNGGSRKGKVQEERKENVGREGNVSEKPGNTTPTNEKKEPKPG